MVRPDVNWPTMAKVAGLAAGISAISMSNTAYFYGIKFGLPLGILWIVNQGDLVNGVRNTGAMVLTAAVVFPLTFELQAILQHWTQQKQHGEHHSPYLATLIAGYNRLQAWFNLQAQNYRDDFAEALTMMDRLLDQTRRLLENGEDEAAARVLANFLLRLTSLYPEVDCADPLVKQTFASGLASSKKWDARYFEDALEILATIDPQYAGNEETYRKLIRSWSALE